MKEKEGALENGLSEKDIITYNHVFFTTYV